MDEVEYRLVSPQAVPSRLYNRPVDVTTIFRRGPPTIDVGSINGETADDFPKRLAQADEGIVPCQPARLGQPVELVGKHPELAGELGIHRLLLALVDRLLEGRTGTDEPLVGSVESLLTVTIDKQAIQSIEKFIPCRTGDRPVFAESLMGRQDFFNNDVKIVAVVIRIASHGRILPDLPDLRLQPLQVLPGIEKAVDMIDAEPIHMTFGDQFKDQPMHVIEYGRHLDPDSGKIVDLKEPPIVDLLGGDAPVRQTIRLRLEQPMQPFETGRRADLAIQFSEGSPDSR